MQRHSSFKMYPQHGQYPVSRRGPTMLARDDKPGAQGVDVTASCDQQNFRSFDNFLKNSFKSDVALNHDFTRYLPAKGIERRKKQTPRGGEKARKAENTYEKTRETPRSRKSKAYALISTVSIAVRAEPECRSYSQIRTQGCAKPEWQCHAS